jgi:hypothetical protein
VVNRILYPSRYCESDRFTEMAASLATGRASGYDQCNAIYTQFGDPGGLLNMNIKVERMPGPTY